MHCCTWNILSFFKLWKICTSKKQYSVAYGCYLICVAVKYVHSTFSLTLKERLYLLPNRFKRILTHNIEKPLPAKLKVLGKKPTHTKNKPTEKELSHSRRLYAFSADSKCSSWVNISAFASLGKQTEPGRALKSRLLPDKTPPSLANAASMFNYSTNFPLAVTGWNAIVLQQNT